INRVANLKIRIVVTSEPEKIELLYDSTLFSVTSPVIPKSVGTHNINLTVRCLKEFGVEQTIKVAAHYKHPITRIIKGKTIGILRVKPNSKALRKSKKILMILVKTNLNGTSN